jgi:hypothetical protein
VVPNRQIYPLLTVLRRGDTAVEPRLRLTTNSDPSGATATAQLVRLATYEVETERLTVTVDPEQDSAFSLWLSAPAVQFASMRPGLYALRFTVTFLDGSIGTFPPDSSMVLNLT